MSNENKSIHEFDFSLICEYFSSVERQGPGTAGKCEGDSAEVFSL